MRHHAAHRTGVTCAATNPETALHINCKLALAAALTEAAGLSSRLTVARTCAGNDRQVCTKQHVTDWLEGWDIVHVEHRVGDTLRPDILLARGNAPIGAIEVVVSNPVSLDKANALAARGLPWAEVQGKPRFAEPDGWSPSEPLAVLRLGVEGAWRCPVHAAMHERATNDAAERAAALHEQSRHASTLHAARVVDLYHDGGARERFIYRVTHELLDGRPVSAHLQRGTRVIMSFPLDSAHGALDAQWPAIRTAFADHVRRLKHGDASVIDSPMQWAMGATAESIVDEALSDRAGADPTPLATRYPRRWFYGANTGRWFLPDDMREVRWDRGELDAFAPHPAWSGRRGAVGERPAPAGSWKTPVFASRPRAEMFIPASDIRVGEGIEAGISVVRPDQKAPRVIVVLGHAPAAVAVDSVAAFLERDGLEAVWLSHPLDWTEALMPYVWAAAGGDGRGRGVVVVDGVGVFRAAAFGRAWAANDGRVTSAKIRRMMAPRIARLGAG
jgi:hypothetical protein